MKPLLYTVAAFLTTSVLADNWPGWRGPNSDSVAAPGDYPVSFSPTENVTWKAELPGKGSSTPVVWGDQIFVTCGSGGKDAVLAFDWDGKLQWEEKLGRERPGKHANGSGANSSPVTDGENLYVYFKSGTVASLTFDGHVNWKINLQEKYGKDKMWWDLATSPVLIDDQLVIAVMQAGGSYLVSLGTADGSETWKVDRNLEAKKESNDSYTSPILTEIDGKQTLVVWGADHLTGHDPKDGSTLWSSGGFNPTSAGNWRVIASPYIADGVAVVPFGRGKFTAGVKLGGSGDITKSHRLWDRKGLGGDCPTPVGRDGKAFLLSDRGKINCIDITTGKDLWKGSIPRASSSYFSSPILAGDLLYCAREDGVLAVVQVSDKGMEVVAQNDIGEQLVALPVPVRGKLLVRGGENLYCFE